MGEIHMLPKRISGIFNCIITQCNQLQNDKTYTPTCLPVHGEFEYLYFICVAQSSLTTCGAVEVKNIFDLEMSSYFYL